MRVKTDCHTLTGTPLEIVKELGKFYLSNHKNDVEGYMKRVTIFKAGPLPKLSGNTLEQRCGVFLKRLNKYGLIKILK